MAFCKAARLSTMTTQSSSRCLVQCEQEIEGPAPNAERSEGMSSTSDMSVDVDFGPVDEKSDKNETMVDKTKFEMILDVENSPQDQEPEIVENTDIQTDVASTEVEWIECAGQIGSLIMHLSKLKKNLESSAVPNLEGFLVETRDIVACCKEITTNLEQNIDSALGKLHTERTLVTEQDLPDPVSSDPGLRPSSLSDSQRIYLGQLGPQQPVLFNYPKNGDIGSHKQKSFCAAWYSQYPFLEYSIEKDAAFCFVCQMFPEGVGQEQSERNWLDTGVRT